jgi:hypothetical protein
MPVPFERFRLLNDTKPRAVKNYGPHPVDVSYDGALVVHVIHPGTALPLDASEEEIHVRSQGEETCMIAVEFEA